MWLIKNIKDFLNSFLLFLPKILGKLIIILFILFSIFLYSQLKYKYLPVEKRNYQEIKNPLNPFDVFKLKIPNLKRDYEIL
ncbi:MAG: hypothetical protein C4347_01425 [Patescibacteria group bacterium]